MFSPLNKNRKVSESNNVSLVFLLNGFQVVRMIKLLRFLGCVDYIRRNGQLGSGWKTTVNRNAGGKYIGFIWVRVLRFLIIKKFQE